MLKEEFLESLKEYNGSYTYLAKINKISISVVTRWICEEDMFELLNLPCESIQLRICDLYKIIPAKQIVKELKIPLYTVSAVLKKYNHKIKSCNHHNGHLKINRTYFNSIDTEHKAYFAGLMLADGNVQESNKKYECKISLKKEDGYILNEFKKELKAINPIREIVTQSGSIQDTFSFYGKELISGLKHIGVIENKSGKTFLSNNIPNDFKRHFIRGFFDGDGSIFNTSSKNSWGISIAVDKQMAIDLQKYFKNVLNVDTTISKGNGNIYALRTSKYNNVKQIMTHLYKDSNIHFTRKYDKYKLMLNSRLNK